MRRVFLKKRTLLLFCIIAVALNMRLPITAIPPLIPALQSTLGLAGSTVGWLTTIPLLAFAVASPIITQLSKRLGIEQTILIFLVALVAGSFLRILPSTSMLFSGTILIGIGIACANVLLPAFIKKHFPKNPTAGITVYSASMILVASLGTAFSGSLIAVMPLKNVMFILALLAVISLIGWLPAFINRTTEKIAAPGRMLQSEKSSSVWKNKVAWFITFFFGIQSLLYYSLMTWIPSIYHAFSYSSVEVNTLATIFQFGSLPCSFFVPTIASHKKGLKAICIFLIFGFVGGLLLTILPLHSFALSCIAVALIGVASGTAFNLSVVFFTQKAANARETAAISGMAQSAGYLLAATGPIVFGAFHGMMDAWQPVLILAVILAAILVTLSFVIKNTPVKHSDEIL